MVFTKDDACIKMRRAAYELSWIGGVHLYCEHSVIWFRVTTLRAVSPSKGNDQDKLMVKCDITNEGR